MTVIKILGAVVLAGLGYATYRLVKTTRSSATDASTNEVAIDTTLEETTMQDAAFPHKFQYAFDRLWDQRVEHGIFLRNAPGLIEHPEQVINTPPMADGVFAWLEGAENERFLILGGGDVNLIVFDQGRDEGIEYLWPVSIEGIEPDAYMLAMLQCLLNNTEAGDYAHDSADYGQRASAA